MSIVAAFKVVEVRHPVMKGLIGYRMKVANINRAQYIAQSGEYVQSFAPRFLIAESGDYKEPPTDKQVRDFMLPVVRQHHLTSIQTY